MLRKLSAAFAAGAAAGVITSALFWYVADVGTLARAGISLKPALTPSWLYLRTTWGGLWGLLLLLPLQQARPLAQGVLVSLVPSAAALFYFLPKGSAGLLGLQAGTFTPLLIVALNALWGVVAALWNAQAAR